MAKPVPRPAPPAVAVPAAAPKPAISHISPAAAARLLYPKAKSGAPLWKTRLAGCPGVTTALRVRCLIGGRYAGHAKARALALALYDAVGVVAGLRPKQVRDGGWRGTLHMVPQLPVGRHLPQLRRVKQSFSGFRQFFTWLGKGSSKPLQYRFTHLSFKFYRTVGKRTPSASAWDWTVAYNVNGSLLGSAAGVRETLYHEIFHLNDRDHRDWTTRALGKIYEGILKRCRRHMVKGSRQGARYQRCLRPYAPYKTKVRKDNVFYAFHHESDVAEYGAELAVRYYLEQRAVMSAVSTGTLRRALGYSAPGAFKCGPTENARAWTLLAQEFFGGVDRTAPCP